MDGSADQAGAVAPERAPSRSASVEQFSLVAGGPFSATLGRLGLLGTDQIPTRRAAIAAAILAWAPPALLSILQSVAAPGYSGWGFFTDATAYARFLIAIPVLIATERYADGRLTLLAREFRVSDLVADSDLPAFNAALAVADRRSSSAVAELILAVASFIVPGPAFGYVVELAGASWEGTLVDGDVVLSWAGTAARFVGTPLLFFLVLRWFWRFLVWTLLLFRVSRLPLQLRPLHPDGSAGLGFMSIYPSVFSGFVFALSCVISSNMVKDLGLEHHDPNTVWIALAAWIAFCLLLFIGPLLVFVSPLYAARERALLHYGRLASQHHLAFHRKYIDEATSGETLLGSPDPSSAADLNSCLQSVQQLRLLPVDRIAVIQLVVAAGVPLLAVVLKQIPLGDLVDWIVGRFI